MYGVFEIITSLLEVSDLILHAITFLDQCKTVLGCLKFLLFMLQVQLQLTGLSFIL